MSPVVSQKYFRTPHVPWSVGGTADDEKVSAVAHMLNVPIRVTEKLDGENNTLTRDGVFARSHEGPPVHASNDWVKARWGDLRWRISPGISVFIEYTFALHSIYYKRMAEERSYLHVIGVRDDSTGVNWSVEEVDMMAEYLELPVVPVLFEGVVTTEAELARIMPGDGKAPSAYGGIPVKMVGRQVEYAPGYDATSNTREGEVARVRAEFIDPSLSIIKAVRPGHVQTDEHWKRNWRAMHEAF